MSLVKKNVGWLGVLCLLGAGALAVFVPWLTRLQWILAIAGAVLLLASLLLNAREAQGVLGRRGTRKRIRADQRVQQLIARPTGAEHLCNPKLAGQAGSGGDQRFGDHLGDRVGFCDELRGRYV